MCVCVSVSLAIILLVDHLAGKVTSLIYIHTCVHAYILCGYSTYVHVCMCVLAFACIYVQVHCFVTVLMYMCQVHVILACYDHPIRHLEGDKGGWS